MIRLIPIGTSDFRDLREKNFEYVDKTNFITEIIGWSGEDPPDGHNIRR